ncbi:MAG: hypothetical protein KJ050_14900, partial [Candidatus Omnitrophica bacterium]|nr:hypothetical protein [Candidatus Omnitrophota bacterium]
MRRIGLGWFFQGVDPRFREDDKREEQERRNAPACWQNGWKVPAVGATFMAPGTSTQSVIPTKVGIHWMAGVDPRFREDDKREEQERR